MAKNLTTVDGTYCKELLANFEEIQKKSYNPTVSVREFISYVENIIKPAKDTKAKLAFIGKLKAKTNKRDIWYLVYNATTCGILYGN